MPVDGSVIAVSVSVTSTRPSVGGVSDDFELLTSNTLTMPCATCGAPSGAGMKHMTP